MVIIQAQPSSAITKRIGACHRTQAWSAWPQPAPMVMIQSRPASPWALTTGAGQASSFHGCVACWRPWLWQNACSGAAISLVGWRRKHQQRTSARATNGRPGASPNSRQLALAPNLGLRRPSSVKCARNLNPRECSSPVLKPWQLIYLQPAQNSSNCDLHLIGKPRTWPGRGPCCSLYFLARAAGPTMSHARRHSIPARVHHQL